MEDKIEIEIWKKDQSNKFKNNTIEKLKYHREWLNRGVEKWSGQWLDKKSNEWTRTKTRVQNIWLDEEITCGAQESWSGEAIRNKGIEILKNLYLGT